MKNTNNKYSNIIVKFCASTKEIFDLLNSLNLTGVQVSTLVNRWAIEVPYWREDYYCQKLNQSQLVEKIYTNKKNYEGDKNE